MGMTDTGVTGTGQSTPKSRPLRILLVHPNYHSGGAEIAGNWPPAWVAYLAGSQRHRSDSSGERKGCA